MSLTIEKARSIISRAALDFGWDQCDVRLSPVSDAYEVRLKYMNKRAGFVIDVQAITDPSVGRVLLDKHLRAAWGYISTPNKNPEPAGLRIGDTNEFGEICP